LDQILCSEIAIGEVFNLLEPEKTPFKFKSISIGAVDYRNLDLPERNTFMPLKTIEPVSLLILP